MGFRGRRALAGLAALCAVTPFYNATQGVNVTRPGGNVTDNGTDIKGGDTPGGPREEEEYSWWKVQFHGMYDRLYEAAQAAHGRLAGLPLGFPERNPLGTQAEQSWWAWLREALLTPAFNLVGFAIFGGAWPQVRSAGARGLSVVAALAIVVALQMAVASLAPLVVAGWWVLWCVLVLLRWLATWGTRSVVTAEGGKQRTLDYRGPEMDKKFDTDYLKKVKAKKASARLLLIGGGELAEVQVEPGQCSPIDRWGMTVGIRGVADYTTKRFNTCLLKTREVHLCRLPDGLTKCPIEGEGLVHVTCTALLEEGEKVDLHALKESSVVGWAANRFRRQLRYVLWGLPRRVVGGALGFVGLLLCPLRGQEAAWTKSPDSESETETQTCQAHQVRWEGRDGGTSLAVGRCDGTDARTVAVLNSDRSGLGGDESARLCPAHRAMYMEERWSKKCPAEGCLRLGTRQIGPARLCAVHADEENSRRRLERGRPPAGDGDDYARLEPPDRLDLGGGMSAEQRLQKAAAVEGRRLARAASPGTRKGTRTPSPKRKVADLLGDLAGRADDIGPTPPAPAPQGVLQAYLAYRSEDMPDVDAREALAAECLTSVEALTERLIAEGCAERAVGTRGLGMLLRIWGATPEQMDTGQRRELPQWPGEAKTGPGRGEGPAPSGPAPASAEPPPPPSPHPASVAGAPKVQRIPRGRLAGGGYVVGWAGDEDASTDAGDSVGAETGGTSLGDRSLGRHAGAGEVGTGRTERLEDCVARMANSMDNMTTTMAKGQADKAKRGAVAGLGREEEEVVLLARGCDLHDVRVCQKVLGKALYTSLRDAAAGAFGSLREVGWDQPMKNRLAIGLSGGYWGGRGAGSIEAHSLSAADFESYTAAQLDDFRLPQEGNVEPKPRYPPTWDNWLKQARRGINIWCLVYGEQYREEMTACLAGLERMHEAEPNRFPREQVKNFWEELHWRFWEELRETLRELKRRMGQDLPRREDIRHFALTPDARGVPWLRLPNVWDLEAPDGWFRTQILRRIERQHHEAVWDIVWRTRKVQGERAGEEPERAAGEEKPRKGGEYPAGGWLSPKELSDSEAHRPLDGKGKPLCFGPLTWAGCNKSAKACSRSHAPPPGGKLDWNKLHPSVKLMIVKRGGLKSQKQIAVADVNGRMQEIRAAYAADAAKARTEGGKARTAGGDGAEPEPTAGGGGRGGGTPEGGRPGRAGAAWAPPAELAEVSYTVAEGDVAGMVKGPDTRWGCEARPGGIPTRAEEVRLPKGYEEYAKRLGEVELPKELGDAPDGLKAYVRTLLAGDKGLGWEEALERCVAVGVGEVAEEAASVLDRLGRVGSSADADVVIGPTTWPQGDKGEPGEAEAVILGEAWRVLDYREELSATRELGQEVDGLQEGSPERRQCLLKAVAAAWLWEQRGQAPSKAAVEAAGQELRLELAKNAAQADLALGEPPDRVTGVENELRMHVHDALTGHHDKDFRILAAFPPERLARSVLVVLRVDYRGALVVETVTGAEAQGRGSLLWTVLHRGHLRVGIPPPGLDGWQWLDAREAAGIEVADAPALGWEHYHDTAAGDPRNAPGELKGCRCCKAEALRRPARPRLVGGEPDGEQRARLGSLLNCWAARVGGQDDPAWEPKTVPGKELYLQEVCAGHAGITRAWRHEGMAAAEPVELYENPAKQEGPREDHDILRREVQERLLREARDPKGPNVWFMAPPCTSFCDWGLMNNGSRTFHKPMGGDGRPLKEVEKVGNRIALFTAKLATVLLEEGKVFFVENQARSGSYPKLWDTPCWKRLLALPEVEVIPWCFCAWGLRPSDGQPHQYYKKRTFGVGTRVPGLMAALGRGCPGRKDGVHEHVTLKGGVPGQSGTRCSEAGKYPEAFCRAWAKGIRAGVLAAETGPKGHGRPGSRSGQRNAGAGGSAGEAILKLQVVWPRGRPPEWRAWPATAGKPEAGGGRWLTVTDLRHSILVPEERQQAGEVGEVYVREVPEGAHAVECLLCEEGETQGLVGGMRCSDGEGLSQEDADDLRDYLDLLVPVAEGKAASNFRRAGGDDTEGGLMGLRHALVRVQVHGAAGCDGQWYLYLGLVQRASHIWVGEPWMVVEVARLQQSFHIPRSAFRVECDRPESQREEDYRAEVWGREPEDPYEPGEAPREGLGVVASWLSPGTARELASLEGRGIPRGGDVDLDVEERIRRDPGAHLTNHPSGLRVEWPRGPPQGPQWEAGPPGDQEDPESLLGSRDGQEEGRDEWSVQTDHVFDPEEGPQLFSAVPAYHLGTETTFCGADRVPDQPSEGACAPGAPCETCRTWQEQAFAAAGVGGGWARGPNGWEDEDQQDLPARRARVWKKAVEHLVGLPVHNSLEPEARGQRGRGLHEHFLRVEGDHNGPEPEPRWRENIPWWIAPAGSGEEGDLPVGTWVKAQWGGYSCENYPGGVGDGQKWYAGCIIRRFPDGLYSLALGAQEGKWWAVVWCTTRARIRYMPAWAKDGKVEPRWHCERCRLRSLVGEGDVATPPSSGTRAESAEPRPPPEHAARRREGSSPPAVGQSARRPAWPRAPPPPPPDDRGPQKLPPPPPPREPPPGLGDYNPRRCGGEVPFHRDDEDHEQRFTGEQGRRRARWLADRKGVWRKVEGQGGRGGGQEEDAEARFTGEQARRRAAWLEGKDRGEAKAGGEMGAAQGGGQPEGGTQREPDAGGASGPGDLEATAYLEGVTGRKEGTAKAWVEAAREGRELVEAAGSVRHAAEALWRARRETGRDNLKGVHEKDWEGTVDCHLLEYLRHVERKGVPARSVGARERVSALPHTSAMDALGQVYQQIYKDVAKGRVLVVPTKVVAREPVMSSPFGAVPKMLPDRSLSEEKRVVHDQRQVNEGVPEDAHPPALQPRHRQLARLVLHWQARYPGVPVLLAKKDIAGAFRLLWVAPGDVELFAGELPWRPEHCVQGDPDEGRDLGEGLVAIYLVLSFGFSGAPGEWMAWATGLCQDLEARRPDRPERDGPERFVGSMLMDDYVLVEPCLGLRPWVARGVLEQRVKALFGHEAINLEKDAVEGEMETSQCCWGLDVDTSRGVVRIPERRIIKGAHLLALPVYEPGNKGLTLLDLQRARGTAQSWSPVHPGLRTELKALDAFLTPAGGARDPVQCRDCAAKTMAAGGPLRFYAGFPTFYVRIAPHAMITLIAQDAIKKFWTSIGA